MLLTYGGERMNMIELHIELVVDDEIIPIDIIEVTA
tara:strand:+ start:303 stop:410 length:108 start_codon:yes stop_codon:yes gene_type:complete